jgi:hypothetical protein
MKAQIFVTFSILFGFVFSLYFYAYMVTIVNFYDMMLIFAVAFIGTIVLLASLEKDIAEEVDLNGNKPFLMFGIVIFLVLTAPIIFFTNGDEKEISYEISDYNRGTDIVFYFNDKQLKDGIEKHNQIAEQKEKSGRK